MGKKHVGEYLVYCIPIRGTAANSEWFSDFNLGDNNGGNHEGFYKAAKEVMGILDGMFSSDGHSASNRILWFTGHSRGAAVANILAGEYSSSGYATSSHVFGYTFACPFVSKNVTEGQSNIYNYNNSGDLIPLLPLASWGYKRYGITKTLAITA